MTTSVRDTIRDWIHEMQTDVELEGGLAILGLLHHNGQGQEVPIQAISNKAQGGGKWGNADALADMFDACATRHALGCVGGGAQQFTLHACFGTSGKPTRMIPFGKMGLAHHGGISGGGLGSEPATGTGALSQSMRLLEVLANGSFSQVQHVTTTQAQLVDKLAGRLDVVEKRSDERWLALQNLLLQWMNQSASLQLRALGIEAGRKLLPLLPAAVSTLTGSDKLIPERAVEDSLFDTLLENQSPEQLQELLSTLSSSSGGGPLAAIIAAHLLRAKKRKAARDRETHELVAGSPPRSYEEAENDAAGVAIRALSGKPVEAKTSGTNGNGHARVQPKTEVPEAGSMDADAVLSTMLETLNDTEIEQVAAMFALKRPDLPGLKDEIKQRYAAVRKAT